MALTNCPECGKEVSDQADQCPHCGYPLKKKQLEEQAAQRKKEFAEQTTQLAEKTRSKKRALVGICAILAAAVLVFVLVVLPAQQRKAENTKPYRTVGNVVTFGRYPQTEAGNDETPIEWLVLDVQGNKAMLLSKYGLDAKRYNTERTAITWENCTLRAWLNKEFLDKAFTAGEQKAILTTSVDNSQSQGYSGWDTNGGNNTRDKVFLLSYAEANKCLDVTDDDSKNTKSRVAPTAYAVKQGAYTSSNLKTAEGAAAGWWWLRSPGLLYIQDYAAIVDDDGSLNINYVGNENACVRPAFWINLESDNA